METHARSLLKAATWRTGGLILTFAVAWALTRKIEMAASIGVIVTAVKLVVYYVHERVWLKIPFGKVRSAEYSI